MPFIDDDLVIGVTQSGETADTLTAFKKAKGHGARTLAVTNVVGSTAARECEDALYIRAGSEISVAATKSFTSQVVTLFLLSIWLGDDLPRGEPLRHRLAALRELPDHVQQILDETPAREVAQK